MTTLQITIEQDNEVEEHTINRIQAAESGEEIEDEEPILYFDSYATMARFLTDRNLELIETIAEHQPSSIRATAHLVDRDYKEVHRNLTELQDLGLVEFKGGEPGKAKQPTIDYDEIEISIPLPGVDDQRRAVTG